MPKNPENLITLPQKLYVADVRTLYSQCKHMVDFRGYSELYLDAEEMELAFPDTMLPIVALMQRYQEDGVRIRLKLPRNAALAQHFVNCNWAHLIDPTQPLGDRDNGRDLPTHVFANGQTQHRLVNLAIDRILRTTTHLSREHLSAIEWSLNEITDNVLVHSASTEAEMTAKATGHGLMQLSIRRASQEIEYVVADSGLGIPHSLRTCVNSDWDDRTALTEAIKEGVTRGTGMGNGLYGSFRICATSGGAFTINSGRAYLSWMRSGHVRVEGDHRFFPGTAVMAAISYARPLVLAEALRFRDRPWIPVDHIETTYEDQEDGVIMFPLATEAEALGSRRCAANVRTKLCNLIAMAQAKRAIIDMAEVPLLSSSFADEVFGKMALALGREGFERLVVFRACSDTNRSLIARALDARLFQASATLDRSH